MEILVARVSCTPKRAYSPECITTVARALSTPAIASAIAATKSRLCVRWAPVTRAAAMATSRPSATTANPYRREGKPTFSIGAGTTCGTWATTSPPTSATRAR